MCMNSFALDVLRQRQQRPVRSSTNQRRAVHYAVRIVYAEIQMRTDVHGISSIRCGLPWKKELVARTIEGLPIAS